MKVLRSTSRRWEIVRFIFRPCFRRSLKKYLEIRGADMGEELKWLVLRRSTKDSFIHGNRLMIVVAS